MLFACEACRAGLKPAPTIAAFMSEQRKNIRLGHQNYLGQRAYFVTTCCYHKKAHFADAQRAQVLIDHLQVLSTSQGYWLHAYCVMPDHAHLLVEGRYAQCDLLKFVALFKQKTAFALNAAGVPKLWQRYYYDHILRPKESWEAVAWYIWLNPVRRGLCAEPEDYPFSGSGTIEWKRKNHPATPWVPPWR